MVITFAQCTESVEVVFLSSGFVVQLYIQQNKATRAWIKKLLFSFCFLWPRLIFFSIDYVWNDK